MQRHGCEKAATGVLALAMAIVGCAKGDTGEAHELQSGIYELNTVDVDGDCVLENAITEGSEFVGKAARVAIDVRSGSVRLEACNDFFSGDRCHTTGTQVEPVSMGRNDNLLFAEDGAWEVADCTCFDEYRGKRVIDGDVISDGEAELRWSFELPAAPASCVFCQRPACSMELTQRLVRE